MTDDPALLTYKRTTRSLSRIAKRRSINLEDVTETRTRRSHQVFICYVHDMDDDVIKRIRKRFAASVRYLLVSEPGRVQAIAERVAQLGIRTPERLHIAAEHEDLWERILSVLSARTRDRVLDAWWDDGLVVLSQCFERLHVSVQQLRSLRFFASSSEKALQEFEIDQDGSFIRWPEPDVDLDWRGLCRLADRDDGSHLERLKKFRTGYGAAIRELRLERDLRQADIKGLDERHVRRIEQGSTSVTASALEKLALSHGMDLNEYLNEIAKRASE